MTEKKTEEINYCLSEKTVVTRSVIVQTTKGYFNRLQEIEDFSKLIGKSAVISSFGFGSERKFGTALRLAAACIQEEIVPDAEMAQLFDNNSRILEKRDYRHSCLVEWREWRELAGEKHGLFGWSSEEKAIVVKIADQVLADLKARIGTAEYYV